MGLWSSWWMDLCFVVIDCQRCVLVLGQGIMGCVTDRFSFMDVFYCSSNQSLGAMVFPLTLVLPFSPNFGGGFGDDGGGQRTVLTASTKDPKGFDVFFSVARVFLCKFGWTTVLFCTYLEGACIFPCICTLCYHINTCMFQKKTCL